MVFVSANADQVGVDQQREISIMKYLFVLNTK